MRKNRKKRTVALHLSYDEISLRLIPAGIQIADKKSTGRPDAQTGAINCGSGQSLYGRRISFMARLSRRGITSVFPETRIRMDILRFRYRAGLQQIHWLYPAPLC